jgi:hypothetical protein
MSGQNKAERKIDIIITGPAAAGKSVAQRLIADMLSDRGYRVTCTDYGTEVRQGGRADWFDVMPKDDYAHAAAITIPLILAGQPTTTGVPEDNPTLVSKAELLTAIANVANGQACQAQVYRAAMIAWQGGLLTDAEFNGVGKTLIAIERER